MDLNFRTLRADEIEVREGNKTKDNTQKTLLLYKDARVDMTLLDEVVKPLNWKREHSRDNANCTVSIWDNEKKQWVSKEDTGTESRTEAEKGLASDSFKRACFNWGIGRELYTAPAIFVDANMKTYGLRVSEITYNDRREIELLTITDRYGNVVYTNKAGAKPAPKPQPKPAQTPAPQPTPTPAPVVNKGGAIYPATEDDDYTAILAEIQSAEDYNMLVRYMRSDRVQKSPYIVALRRVAHNFAKQKGWE